MSLGLSLSYESSSSSRPELMARVRVQDLDSNSTRCHAMQDLSEAICSHLFQLDAFGDNYSLLLQVLNVVEVNVNMLGMLGPVTCC